MSHRSGASFVPSSFLPINFVYPEYPEQNTNFEGFKIVLINPVVILQNLHPDDEVIKPESLSKKELDGFKRKLKERESLSIPILGTYTPYIIIHDGRHRIAFFNSIGLKEIPVLSEDCHALGLVERFNAKFLDSLQTPGFVISEINSGKGRK